MTATSIDGATGNLLVGGKRVFPLGLSDPPPVDGMAPNGKPAWAEVASAGVNFARNYTTWTAAAAAEQLLSVGEELEAAAEHGMQMWVALAGIDNDLSRKALLDRIVNTVKPHPGLGVWTSPARLELESSSKKPLLERLPDVPVLAGGGQWRSRPASRFPAASSAPKP
jgi:hypothetical protein